jgi:hypothetical protein
MIQSVLVLLLLLVVPVTVLVVPVTAPAREAESLEAGNEAAGRGEIEAAIGHYTRAIEDRSLSPH